MTLPPLCPYCDQFSKLAMGSEIYPHRPALKELKFWQCAPCKAYVGCHKEGALITVNGKRMISDGKVPLGRLADAELRRAKSAAHQALDGLWRTRMMSRNATYRWLAKELQMSVDDCHIGMFNLEQCKAVIEAVEQHNNLPLEKV